MGLFRKKGRRAGLFRNRQRIDDNGITLRNEISNGNFMDGVTGWTGLFGGLAAEDNKLTQTGDGTQRHPIVRKTINLPNIPGHKYFLRVRIRVLSAGAQALVLKLIVPANLEAARANTPTANNWYELSGVVTVGSSGTPLTISGYDVQHIYADNPSASGKVMEVTNVMLINLTSSFGEGKEPTAPEMEILLNQFPNKWFDGTKRVQV